MRFRDQVAIVTGAGGGIGFAVAERLAREGASIVMAERSPEKAQERIEALKGAGAPDVSVIGCDVAIEAEVEACCEAALARYGRLDVVVNNAGVMGFVPLAELTGEEWSRVLGVDLLGAFYFIKQAFLRMGSGGAVVNVASVHAEMTTPLVAPYAAAKAAMVSLTRSAAIEGRDRNIRCNVVLPGAVDTAMLWDNPNLKSGAEAIAPQDVGRPEDIAGAVAFLASADAAFVTGAALAVDGGRLARL